MKSLSGKFRVPILLLAGMMLVFSCSAGKYPQKKKHRKLKSCNCPVFGETRHNTPERDYYLI
jgi:hypothetical protein